MYKNNNDKERKKGRSEWASALLVSNVFISQKLFFVVLNVCFFNLFDKTYSHLNLILGTF